MEEHTEDAKNEEEAARLPVGQTLHYHTILERNIIFQVKIAIYASLICNFALSVLQCKCINLPEQVQTVDKLSI